MLVTSYLYITKFLIKKTLLVHWDHMLPLIAQWNDVTIHWEDFTNTMTKL